MIGETMERALNGQINAELYSAYLYLSMSACFQGLGRKGFSQWMRVQAAEEMVHVMKLYDYVQERGGKATLTTVEGPPTAWDSPLAAFEQAYAHEQKVTGLINGLVDLAVQQSDHAAHSFLQWYVTEQVEEEASASAVVADLRAVAEDSQGLLMLDRELGQRLFVLPAGMTLPVQGGGG